MSLEGSQGAHTPPEAAAVSLEGLWGAHPPAEMVVVLLLERRIASGDSDFMSPRGEDKGDSQPNGKGDFSLFLITSLIIPRNLQFSFHLLPKSSAICKEIKHSACKSKGVILQQTVTKYSITQAQILITFPNEVAK